MTKIDFKTFTILLMIEAIEEAQVILRRRKRIKDARNLDPVIKEYRKKIKRQQS